MTVPLRLGSTPRVPHVATPAQPYDRGTLLLVGATAWLLLLLVGLYLTF